MEPLNPRPPATPAVGAKGPALPAVVGKTVLLAEPDRSLAELYRRTLESEGWTVEVVGDADSALNRVEVAPLDLLLVNSLPDMNAVLFMQRVRSLEASRTLAVVALANADELSVMERAMKRFGILAVLTKNRMTRERLCTTLASLMAEDRARA